MAARSRGSDGLFLGAGAASFVVEPSSDAILCHPVKRADAYATNIAVWLVGYVGLLTGGFWRAELDSRLPTL